MTEKKKNYEFKFVLSLNDEEGNEVPIITRSFNGNPYNKKTRHNVDIRHKADEIIALVQQVDYILKMIQDDMKMKDIEYMYKGRETFLQSLKEKYNKN